MGPEIIVRLMDHLDPQYAYIIYGEEKILKACARELGRDFTANLINSPQEVNAPGVYLIDLNICDVERPSPLTLRERWQ